MIHLFSIIYYSLAATLVPGVILSLIGIFTPKLMVAITKMEQWDSANMELNLCMLRMYMSSTLNLLLLSFSFCLLADPFLLVDHPIIRSNLQVEYSGQFACRLDQVANGLFTTVITSQVSHFFIMSIPDIKAKVMKHFELTSPSKEFDVADRIVESLKFQGDANPHLKLILTYP